MSNSKYLRLSVELNVSPHTDFAAALTSKINTVVGLIVDVAGILFE